MWTLNAITYEFKRFLHFIFTIQHQLINRYFIELCKIFVFRRFVVKKNIYYCRSEEFPFRIFLHKCIYKYNNDNTHAKTITYAHCNIQSRCKTDNNATIKIRIYDLYSFYFFIFHFAFTPSNRPSELQLYVCIMYSLYPHSILILLLRPIPSIQFTHLSAALFYINVNAPE